MENVHTPRMFHYVVNLHNETKATRDLIISSLFKQEHNIVSMIIIGPQMSYELAESYTSKYSMLLEKEFKVIGKISIVLAEAVNDLLVKLSDDDNYKLHDLISIIKTATEDHIHQIYVHGKLSDKILSRISHIFPDWQHYNGWFTEHK